MTLHEAIVIVLTKKGRSMSTSEIADELNINKLYSKKDGSRIIAYQIHGRTNNYPGLFERNGSMVGLKNSRLEMNKSPLKKIVKKSFSR